MAEPHEKYTLSLLILMEKKELSNVDLVCASGQQAAPVYHL